MTYSHLTLDSLLQLHQAGSNTSALEGRGVTESQKPIVYSCTLLAVGKCLYHVTPPPLQVSVLFIYLQLDNHHSYESPQTQCLSYHTSIHTHTHVHTIQHMQNVCTRMLCTACRHLMYNQTWQLHA